MGFRLATAAVVAAASLTLAGAETTRTLKIELPADVHGAFAVENLAGVMRVTVGSSDRVVATATVHAEDAAAAAGVQFLQVTGDDGTPTLRVRYPLSDYDTIRYPGHRSDDGMSFLAGLFGGSNTTTKYDGHKAKVSSSSGTLLYADVEIQIPKRAVEATFRNLVGKLEGTGAEGKILFDTSSGDIVLERVRGSIRADTGSGDVKVSDVGGDLKCDTGSGDCTISAFDGGSLSCDVGSGDITIRGAKADRIATDSGSGDVQVEDADVSEVVADSGSGNIHLQARGARLARVKADTGSGDVRLELDPDSGFEVRADQGSGDIQSRFRDAEPILKDRTVVGYRRGDGRIRISVETGSGDLVVEPSR
ncbi:MAG: DUF4097 family beta strand repeat protein [Acidobacteria bacterium]|nr:DUF4097 family beta strand repeat protein [Acidobacteriota bacterium]